MYCAHRNIKARLGYLYLDNIPRDLLIYMSAGGRHEYVMSPWNTASGLYQQPVHVTGTCIVLCLLHIDPDSQAQALVAKHVTMYVIYLSSMHSWSTITASSFMRTRSWQTSFWKWTLVLFAQILLSLPWTLRIAVMGMWNFWLLYRTGKSNLRYVNVVSLSSSISLTRTTEAVPMKLSKNREHRVRHHIIQWYIGLDEKCRARALTPLTLVATQRYWYWSKQVFSFLSLVLLLFWSPFVNDLISQASFQVWWLIWNLDHAPLPPLSRFTLLTVHLSLFHFHPDPFPTQLFS